MYCCFWKSNNTLTPFPFLSLVVLAFERESLLMTMFFRSSHKCQRMFCSLTWVILWRALKPGPVWSPPRWSINQPDISLQGFDPSKIQATYEVLSDINLRWEMTHPADQGLRSLLFLGTAKREVWGLLSASLGNGAPRVTPQPLLEAKNNSAKVCVKHCSELEHRDRLKLTDLCHIQSL